MYNYELEKKCVFTDVGQRNFIKVRDFAMKAFEQAGAVTAGKLMEQSHMGESWQDMAIVDRLIELGEAYVLGEELAWQHRVLRPVRRG